MVIQRWQSVFLLLAVACMVVYCFMSPDVTSLADGQQEQVVLKSNTWLWIPAVVSAALYFIAIFLFKSFSAQLWTLYAANGCAIITGALLLWATMTDTLAWSLAFPLGAIIFGIIARVFIVKDRERLRSYDRLR